MGGGGVMRAAAKAAGVGVINSGFRGVPGVGPAEHQVTSLARNGSRSISANVSVSDDWEIVGEPMPRLVFGGVPTIEESREATSELKHALYKAYLSPEHTGSGYLLNSDYLETKSSVASATTGIPSVPKHAMQAFKFINDNPAAQNVVAAIACDPNVWTAVMANEAVVGFLQSHKNNINILNMVPPVEESVADADFQIPQSPKCVDESSECAESAPGNWFSDSLHNVKLTVVEMMTSLSGYFQSFFGGAEAGKVYAEADGSAKTTVMDGALGLSFMGLAIMVILMVVLKRG